MLQYGSLKEGTTVDCEEIKQQIKNLKVSRRIDVFTTTTFIVAAGAYGYHGIVFHAGYDPIVAGGCLVAAGFYGFLSYQRQRSIDALKAELKVYDTGVETSSNQKRYRR